MRLLCRFTEAGVPFAREATVDVREVLACKNPMTPLVETCMTIYRDTHRTATSMELTQSEWDAVRRSEWWRSFVKYAGGLDEDIDDPRTLAYALGIPRYSVVSEEEEEP